MKNILLLTLTFLSVGFASAQDTPGSSVVSSTLCGNCAFISGNLTPLTPSAVPVCSGISTKDAFYTFPCPAPTIAGDSVMLKFTLQGLAFDGVIQLLNNATTVSYGCSNAVVGTGAEDLTVMLSNTLVGQTLHIRVHAATAALGSGAFQLCIKQIPELKLRPQFICTNNVGEYYQLNDIMQREFFNNPAPVQKTGWLLIDQITQSQHYAEVTGTSSQILLSQVPNLCYDRDYMVFVRVQIGGIWCGYGVGKKIRMAEWPETYVIPVAGGVVQCGGTFCIYQAVLQAIFLSPGQVYEWEFTTDNGQTVVICQGAPGSSIIELTDCPDLLYNKIYSIRIRAQICGVWGPFVDTQCYIFTCPIPYTQLRPDFCPSSQGPGGHVIANFVANATEYAFKWYPIECGDTDFENIGNALVHIDTDNIFFFSSLPELYPGCWGVEVKPIIGIQEGDYGNPCQVTINGPIAPPFGMSEQNTDLKELATGLSEEALFLLYPNPNEGLFEVLLDTGASELPILFKVFDMSGKQVISELHPNGGRSLYSFSIGMPRGMYVMTASSGDFVHSERFAVTR